MAGVHRIARTVKKGAINVFAVAQKTRGVVLPARLRLRVWAAHKFGRPRDSLPPV